MKCALQREKTAQFGQAANTNPGMDGGGCAIHATTRSCLVQQSSARRKQSGLLSREHKHEQRGMQEKGQDASAARAAPQGEAVAEAEAKAAEAGTTAAGNEAGDEAEATAAANQKPTLLYGLQQLPTRFSGASGWKKDDWQAAWQEQK